MPVRSALIAMASLLAACGGAPAPEPACSPWSDAATWSEGVVPGVGAAVDTCAEIPAGRCVLFDVARAELAQLHVRGTLVVSDTRHAALRADRVVVDGALQVGRAEQPFTHRFALELTDEHMQPVVASGGADSEPFWTVSCPDGPSTIAPSQPPRSLLVRDGATLDLHGAVAGVPWTTTRSTSGPGTSDPHLLELAEAAGWSPGDAIAVGPTDFDPLEAELRVVDRVEGDRVWTRMPLRETHLVASVRPDLDPTGGGIPVHAEVASLSRNIEVVGVDTEVLPMRGSCADEACTRCSFKACSCPPVRPTELAFDGAEIRVETAHHGAHGGPSPTVRIDGIRVTRGGKYGSIGHYPIHFHELGSVPGSYVRRTAVDTSSNRAIVVHGTSDVALEDNVAFDILGHAFYLEQSTARRTHRNELDHNLAMRVRACNPLDEALGFAGPGGFFGRDPENTWTDNVAAGSDYAGFYLNHQPGDPCDGAGEPSSCPRVFVGNTAHSSLTGLWSDGKVETTVEIDDFTATKVDGRGVWVHNRGVTRVSGLRTADVGSAVYFSFKAFHRTVDPVAYLTDALIVGQPEGLGARQYERKRATGEPFPRMGVELYEGRIIVEDSTFADFPAQAPDAPPMAAIGRHRDLFPYDNDPLNSVRGLTLVDANPVYMGAPEPQSTGTATVAVFDIDGSLTGTAHSWVTAPHPFFDLPGATWVPEWDGIHFAQGDADLVQLLVDWVPSRDSFGEGCADRMDTVWLDGAGGVELEGKLPKDECARQGANVISGEAYAVHWLGFQGEALPGFGTLDVLLRAGAPGARVRVTLPTGDPDWTGTVHRGTEGDDGVPLEAAASLEEVDGDHWFFDASTGLMHVMPVIGGNGTSPLDGEGTVLRIRAL